MMIKAYLLASLIALGAMYAANVAAGEINPNRAALEQAGVTTGTASGASGFPGRPDGVRRSRARAFWGTVGAVGVAAGIAALLSVVSSSDSGSSSSSVTTTTSTQ
jgi:hypothetical protein